MTFLRLALACAALTACTAVAQEAKKPRDYSALYATLEKADADLNKIRERLAAALAIRPVLEAAVDPSILGGLRVRVGDTVYDGSLRARLKQLRHRVRERSLHEIQSGRNRFSHPERD